MNQGGEIDELIERMEAATGPDRLLDADIASALGDYVKCEPGNRSWRSAPTRKGPWRGLPAYTADLEADINLAARELPGWEWSAGSLGPDGRAWVCLTEPGGACRDFDAGGRTVQYAFLAALLNALKAQP